MEKWKQYLISTKEKNYNVEHLESLKKNNNNLVYDYVNRALRILKQINVSDEAKKYAEKSLQWMDVAKTGTKEQRREWKKKGYNLFAHNLGSAEIYKENKNYDEIVYTLIKTHGLIGQYIRGEVNFCQNRELYSLVEKKLISKSLLKEVLIALNRCVIEAVSTNLYENIKDQIKLCVENIINNKFDEEFDIIERINRLNGQISKESKKELTELLRDKRIKNNINNLFNKVDVWYYQSALSSFNIVEQIKILLICYNQVINNKQIEHITFEKIMKSMYLDYNGKKEINLFKKRIIEEYLKNIEIETILNNKTQQSPHISFKLTKKEDTFLFDFKFSIEATKLIDFCEVAVNSNALYKKSIYLLYDLFGFRKDQYDRFYNETEYLNTMNSSLKNKAPILEYMVGKNILDVGPGGGALRDLIEQKDENLNVYGIDISSNVIDALTKKKLKENKKWNLVKGDALNLDNYFKKGGLDTIIYSSIIHELYSYIPYNGKKFNIDTIKQALKSSYGVLPKGGRIIIRDGIKTEPENQYRIIEFKDISDIEILNRYCKDFKGRKISYEKIDENKVKMLVNDAMEFLYTYTWGEDSYPLEVQEQFGYLTPTEYIKLIKDNLDHCKILVCNAFLQEGYESNLLNKISFYDENMNISKLPNSTCIIVIEKQ